MELRRLHFRAQLVAGGVVGGGKAAEVVVGGDGINGEECQPRSFGGFPDVAVRTYTYAADLSDPADITHLATEIGRVDILAVLDGVKKDRTLFPEAVIAMSDRLNAKETTRHATSPKALGGRGRCKLQARD